MTRKLILLMLVLSLLLIPVALAMAAPGGIAGGHGVDGRTFGEMVSALAQTDPMALVEHIKTRRGLE
jgi:hypothetical protein